MVNDDGDWKGRVSGRPFLLRATGGVEHDEVHLVGEGIQISANLSPNDYLAATTNC
jgi:hypothetical protein